MPIGIEEWRAGVGSNNAARSHAFCKFMKKKSRSYRSPLFSYLVSLLTEGTWFASDDGELVINVKLHPSELKVCDIATSTVCNGTSKMMKIGVIAMLYMGLFITTCVLCLSGDIETNPGPGPEFDLIPANLENTEDLIWDARSKWFSLGLSLRVDHATLTMIKESNPDGGNYFREMLSEWLKSAEPSWEELLAALSKPSVGYKPLAKKLARKLEIYFEFDDSDEGNSTLPRADGRGSKRYLDLSKGYEAIKRQKCVDPTLPRLSIELDLIPENLGAIQDLICDAQNMWFNLGLGLHIEVEILKIIQCEYCSVSSHFREMLYYWLSMSDPLPSWEDLIAALEKKSVGCDEVADIIRRTLGIPEPMSTQDPGKTIHTTAIDLIPNNLGEIQDLIFDASPMWFNLGLRLNIQMRELKMIKSEYSDVSSCFREMLYHWLIIDDPLPSWEDLILSLEKKSVGCDDVAEVIRLMLGVPKAMPNPVKAIASTTVDLIPENLKRIKDLIFDAQDMWFSLGLGLHIEVETLKKIQKNKALNSVSSRFNEMLHTWLKSIDPLPSWEGLISALEKRSVGCNDVAEVIRLMLGAPKGTKGHGMEITDLISDNLGEIQDLIFDASPMWFNLGLGLHITMSELEKIQYDHKDVSSRFREMVYYWLKMEDPLPSWEGLISALEKKSVGCADIAQVIRLMFNIPKQTQEPVKAITSAAVDLIPENLGEIQDLIFDAKDMWFNFGLALHIKINKLEIIKKKHFDEVDSCFREMLYTWLKMTVDPLPSWENLLLALAKKSVGCNNVADDVRLKLSVTVQDPAKAIAPNSISAVNLIPENLGEIQDLLFDAQDVWFKLGLGLQIEKEKLESIECDHHNVSSCFREMLYYWLKMVYPSTSWEGLISALTKKSVGCDNVAEAIKLMLLPQDAADFSGIVFYGSPIHQSITSKGATILSEDTGISLSIPEYSLSDGEDQVDVYIHPCFSGPFELSPGYESASPAYLIHSTRRVNLQRNVTLQIHHYANLVSEEDCEEMVFLSASTTPQFQQSRPVYIFKEIKQAKGIFKPNCQVGKIVVSHFCFVKICRKRRHRGQSFNEENYSIRLYRSDLSALSQRDNMTVLAAVFCMCLDQPMLITHCNKKILKDYRNISFIEGEARSDRLVKMTANEVTLSVIAKSEGWNVTFDKEPTKIQRRDIIMINTDYPPKFLIYLSYNGNDHCRPPKLLIQGLDVENCSFEIITPSTIRRFFPSSLPPPLSPPMQRNLEDLLANVGLQQTDADTQIESGKHQQVAGYLQEIETVKLIELGQCLGLNRMRLKRSGSKELIGDLVTSWINRDDRVLEKSGLPTWRSLAKALQDVHMTGISEDIQRDFSFQL